MKILLIVVLFINSCFAHAFWINIFENEKQEYFTTNLGWGHRLPIDETLNFKGSKALIDEFNIIHENRDKISLNLDLSKEAKLFVEKDSYSIHKVENPTYKISINKKSNENSFAIEAKTKKTFYTKYVDNKNRVRFKLLAKDEIKNAKKILASSLYQAFAKSYINFGEKQKTLGHNLEIIPKTDLSNLKVGDIVKVEVLFEGEPLKMSEKSVEYITAYSETFGQNKGYNLISYLENGKAQIEILSKGKWMIGCFHKEDTKGSENYKKANSIYNVATLTFNVK